MLNTATEHVPTLVRWGYPVYTSLSLAKEIAFPTFLHRTLKLQSAKNLFPDIFDRIKDLRNDIFIFQNTSSSLMGVSGSNFWSLHAVVSVNKELLKIAPNAAKFLLLHEFGHVYYSHCVKACTRAATASLIAAFVMPYFQKYLPKLAAIITYILPSVIGYQVLKKSLSTIEKEADNFALNHSTNEELLEIELFTKLMIDMHVSLYAKNPTLLTRDGNLTPKNSKIDLPLTDRQIDLRTEIAKRNLTTLESSTTLATSINNFLHKRLVKLKFNME